MFHGCDCKHRINGETRYYETGVQSYAGLVYWNGYYYYFNSSKTAVKNCSYWVTNTNGLMASASYTFDAQGRMVNPPSNVATMSIGEDTAAYVAPASATAITTTEEHQYFYAGGKLLREEVTTTAGTSTNSYTLDFVYDQSGRPYAFMYGNVYYYYITNLQGDVMSIVDGSGNVVASYEYDPYGNVIEAAGILAEINPLRYRGYVYDSETDLYYCQSRYYDPAIGRFINADSYISTGQGIVGNNMFAYCGDNPVNCVDPTGHCFKFGLFRFWDCGSASCPDSDNYMNTSGKTPGTTMGYPINGQKNLPFADTRIGLGSYGDNGCGIIAIYNAMQLRGEQVSLLDVERDVADKMIAFGAGGLTP